MNSNQCILLLSLYIVTILAWPIPRDYSPATEMPSHLGNETLFRKTNDTTNDQGPQMQIFEIVEPSQEERNTVIDLSNPSRPIIILNATLEQIQEARQRALHHYQADNIKRIHDLPSKEGVINLNDANPSFNNVDQNVHPHHSYTIVMDEKIVDTLTNDRTHVFSLPGSGGP